MLRKYIVLFCVLITSTLFSQVVSVKDNGLTLYTGISTDNLTFSTYGILKFADVESDSLNTFLLRSGHNIVVTSDTQIEFCPGFSSEDGCGIIAYIVIPNFGFTALSEKKFPTNIANTKDYISFIYSERYLLTGLLNYKVFNENRVDFSSNVSFVEGLNVKSGSNKFTMNVRNLPAGIYSIEITDIKDQKFYLRFKRL